MADSINLLELGTPPASKSYRTYKGSKKYAEEDFYVDRAIRYTDTILRFLDHTEGL